MPDFGPMDIILFIDVVVGSEFEHEANDDIWQKVGISITIAESVGYNGV